MSDLPLITATLLMHAATVDDIEAARVATQLRIGANIRDKELDPDHPLLDPLYVTQDRLLEVEEEEIKSLRRVLRQHPLGPWIKKTVGIGEKQGARLIAALGGDPAWNFAEGRLRRSPMELWAYAGYGTHNGKITAVKRKGETINWNPEVKTRAYLVATACVRYRHGPYRTVYDLARERFKEAVHEEECRRCGPKGKPAQPGSELSDGHKHARALRAISKTVLKDLYNEARLVLHGLEFSES